MARKRADTERTDISPELHARIVELSTLLWQGNRSKMARELGIDQPTVSRVLAGEQKPSGRFLERLANCSQVNVGWLFLGQGERLSVPGMRPGVGGYRPLLHELLPGPLLEHRHHIAGVSYPVAAAFDTQTSYWFGVPANSPVTTSDYKVRGDDLMLMETDPNWTHSGAVVPGKFCGFSIGRGKARTVLLGRVDAFDHSPLGDGYEQYRVDMFKKSDKAWLIVPLDATGEANARRSLPEVCLNLGQVVCVCMKLERTFIKGTRRGTQEVPTA